MPWTTDHLQQLMSLFDQCICVDILLKCFHQPEILLDRHFVCSSYLTIYMTIYWWLSLTDVWIFRIPIFFWHVFYTKVYKYKTLGICNLFNDVAEDRDSIKKYFLIQELIVIMEQDWGVWHWWKPEGWNSNFSDVPAIGTSRKYP